MTKIDVLDAIAKWAGSELPERFVAVLDEHGGMFCSEFVRLYSIDEIIDRNEVYETKKYCPGFLTIADDSGGRAVMIALGRVSSSVYLVDHGSMMKEDFTEIAPDIDTWMKKGCPVD